MRVYFVKYDNGAKVMKSDFIRLATVTTSTFSYFIINTLKQKQFISYAIEKRESKQMVVVLPNISLFDFFVIGIDNCCSSNCILCCSFLISLFRINRVF